MANCVSMQANMLRLYKFIHHLLPVMFVSVCVCKLLFNFSERM